MLKRDVVLGLTYRAKVSGQKVIVRLDSEHRLGGWSATNLKTGRPVRIKTAARLTDLGEAPATRGRVEIRTLS